MILNLKTKPVHCLGSETRPFVSTVLIYCKCCSLANDSWFSWSSDSHFHQHYLAKCIPKLTLI